MDNRKKPDVPMDDDMANELEILRLMQEFQSGEPQPAAPTPAAADRPAAPAGPSAPPPAPSLSPAGGPAQAAARPKRFFKEVALDILNSVIPKKGDAPLEIVRKCVFIVALIVLIGSVSYIINDMLIIPSNNAKMYNELGSLYDPDGNTPLKDEYKDFDYPEGMDDAFKNLYPLNTDLRGWIKYNSNAKNDFLKIDYPILYSGDNEKYLTEDFYHNKGNKNGALFFDYRNSIESPEDHNKVTIVYGHNMASGQMFSGLNKFINSVYNVRSAPLITMNTLYHRNQYKVFAIIMADDDAQGSDRFNYLRTQFSSDTDFLNFVDELRARSMYDFNSVDVQADDDLLILSTCTAPSVLDEGRLAVIARRVRDGESATVDTRQITENTDVIMPKYWYEKHNKTMHPYYTDENYTIPSSNVSSPGTTDHSPSSGMTWPTGTFTTTDRSSATSTAPTSRGSSTGTATTPRTSAQTSATATQTQATAPPAATSGSTAPASTAPPADTTASADTTTAAPPTTSTAGQTTESSQAPSETPSEPSENSSQSEEPPAPEG